MIPRNYFPLCEAPEADPTFSCFKFENGVQFSTLISNLARIYDP